MFKFKATLKSGAFIYFILVLLFLAVRLPDLGPDISNSDAARWHFRSIEFQKALKLREFAKTFQHNQPGVTILWLSSFGSLFTKNPAIDTQNLAESSVYLKVHTIGKRLLVVLLAALFILQLRLINRLFGITSSFIYGVLIASEPYLIGIDRIFHLTSIESYFLFTSFLLILLWQSTGRKMHLIASAVLLSLALLSKTSVLTVMPVYLIVFILRYQKTRDGSIFVFFVTLCLTYFLLFPALWVSPVDTLNRLYGGAANAISRDARTISYNGLLFFLYYPLLFIFRSSPIILAAFLLFLASFRKTKYAHNPYLLLLYIFLYYFAFSLSVKKIDRYIIPMFPPIILCCALYLSYLKKRMRVYILSANIIFLLVVSYIYFPVYSAYYSPVFGGPKVAQRLNIYTNSGQYFAQAAAYLNTIETDKGIVVPYNKESFHYYLTDKLRMQDSVNANTGFFVISFNKPFENTVPKRCFTLAREFGSKLDEIVFVYKCNNRYLEK